MVDPSTERCSPSSTSNSSLTDNAEQPPTKKVKQSSGTSIATSKIHSGLMLKVQLSMTMIWEGRKKKTQTSMLIIHGRVIGSNRPAGFGNGGVQSGLNLLTFTLQLALLLLFLFQVQLLNVCLVKWSLLLNLLERVCLKKLLRLVSWNASTSTVVLLRGLQSLFCVNQLNY